MTRDQLITTVANALADHMGFDHIEIEDADGYSPDQLARIAVEALNLMEEDNSNWHETCATPRKVRLVTPWVQG